MKKNANSSIMDRIVGAAVLRVSRLMSGPTWKMSTWWPSDSQQSKQRSLLRVLAFSHRQRINPTPLVANLAIEHRGHYRRTLNRLAVRLEQGTPLMEALEQTPDTLSEGTVLAMRYAIQIGTLDSAYQELLDMPDLGRETNQSKRRTLAYCFGMFSASSILFTFLASSILPMEIGILEELRLEVPFSLASLGTFAETLALHMPTLVLVAIFFAGAFLSPVSRRFFRRVIETRWIPYSRESRSAELLRLLSMAPQHGRPLSAAISTLARYHFNATTRNRLLFVRNEVEQGTDVWSSMLETRLLNLQESKSLSALSSESLAWGMRELANRKARKVAKRRHCWADIVHTLVILCFAAFVLWVCIAVFSMLIRTTDIA